MFCERLASKDLYDLLRVTTSADTMEIRTAYRRAALRTHPDKMGGSTQAFHAVAFAFDVLSCHVARSMYDRARAAQSDAAFTRLSKSTVAKAQTEVKTQSNSLPRKRRASHEREGTTPKRFCAVGQGTRRVASSSGKVVDDVGVALEKLRSVLQSMLAGSRQTSLASLSARTRKALFMFMRSVGNKAKMSRRSSMCRDGHASLAKGRPQQLRLQPSKSTHGRTYCATVNIASMRFYTRGQRDVEKAIEHQLILSQMRDALNAEALDNCEAWNDAGKMHEIVGTVLRRSGATREELGLRVCVQMRATEYVDRKYVMTSPFMSLAKALPLRACLLSARSDSWESFRSQWIKLMCCTRNARSRKLSQQDVEMVINKARQDFLEGRFKLISSSVERVLEREERRISRQQNRVTRSRLTVLRKGDICDQWKERMGLLLKRGLSTEEMKRFNI